MPDLHLGGKRTDPKPDRRLGIKLAAPTPDRRLGGKLNAYVPPGAQYDYEVAPVFVRYKVLTVVFVTLALGLSSYWVWAMRHAPAKPAAGVPATGVPATASAPRDGTRHTSPPQAPPDQPIYIEPLPPR